MNHGPPLFAFEPAGRRLIESLVGIPYDSFGNVASVTLRIAANEVVTVTVEHVIDVDQADDIIHTFIEERFVTIGVHE